MRDIAQMIHGKRSAQWDHTSLLILTMRKMAGDKKAKLLHPYHEDTEKQTFKKFNEKFRKKKKEDGNNNLRQQR